MTDKHLALLIGGGVPALLLGLSGIFQKLGTNAGLATGPFLIGVGLTTAVVGAVFLMLEPDSHWTSAGALYTCLFGVAWAIATGCVGVALRRYGAQISQLVPLYNMNTLVAVLIGLVALGEWRTVSAPRALVAAVLIILGGVLASKS